MKTYSIILFLLVSITLSARAATMPVDTGKVGTAADPKDPPLIFSGSVDTYWKYDFSGHGNIPTSFAWDQQLRIYRYA